MSNGKPEPWADVWRRIEDALGDLGELESIDAKPLPAVTHGPPRKLRFRITLHDKASAKLIQDRLLAAGFDSPGRDKALERDPLERVVWVTYVDAEDWK